MTSVILFLGAFVGALILVWLPVRTGRRSPPAALEEPVPDDIAIGCPRCGASRADVTRVRAGGRRATVVCRGCREILEVYLGANERSLI